MSKFSCIRNLLLIIIITLAGCDRDRKCGVYIQKEKFSKSLYYEIPRGYVVDIKIAASDSKADPDIAIYGNMDKYIIDRVNKTLKKRVPHRDDYSSGSNSRYNHIKKRVLKKNNDIVDLYFIKKCNWPTEDCFLAYFYTRNHTGGICFFDSQGNIIVKHYLDQSVFFLRGTPVKFFSDQAPYFAVLAKYRSSVGQSELCIFNPVRELVYKELIRNTKGLLAIDIKNSERQRLLVGDRSKVYEYRPASQ